MQHDSPLGLALIGNQSNQISQLPQSEFSKEQVQLMKDTICKDSTDDEFKLFLIVAKKSGLDPFTRQIHAVKRWDSNLRREAMTIQTGIDGYRLIADRTQRHMGTDDAIFVVGKDSLPVSATVTVYKVVGGMKCAFSATARWSEYKQTKKDGSLNSFWAKMPFGQLAKCAEALALRKAFPQELSGIYTHEEMGQAENVAERDITPPKQANPPKNPPLPLDQVKLSPDYHLFLNRINLCKDMDGLKTVFTEAGVNLNRDEMRVLAVAKDKAKETLTKAIADDYFKDEERAAIGDETPPLEDM